jgi:hypothetical protein
VETTLHRQLKDFFREPNAPIEVSVDRYRIDVINGDRLVEIQRSGLASIRNKIATLLQRGFNVDVVKPIVVRKRLIKLDSADGREVDRRWSPRAGTILDLFDELLYFTQTFPHPQLRLIAPLITIEETRYPGHGKRRRKRVGDYLVRDRQILELHETHHFETVVDLQQILNCHSLPSEFDTNDLAQTLQIQRHDAQRIAYVMRKTGSFVETGKIRNTIRYRLVKPLEAKRALIKKAAPPAARKLARAVLKRVWREQKSA